MFSVVLTCTETAKSKSMCSIQNIIFHTHKHIYTHITPLPFTLMREWSTICAYWVGGTDGQMPIMLLLNQAKLHQQRPLVIYSQAHEITERYHRMLDG